MDLPYRSEYAKTGRSSCRNCKSSIGQGILRIAALVQNPRFDGKTPQWYHMKCFFFKHRPKSVDDIENFESLRNEDQIKVQKNISAVGVILPSAKKGKKRSAAVLKALKDFNIEYAKSGRAFCRGCETKILKDEIRVSKKDYTSESGMRFGGVDGWHHVTCFAKLRIELGYFASGEDLPGFNDLKEEDRQAVLKDLPPIKQEDGDQPAEKKVKEDPLDLLIKKQNKEMHKNRDLLKSSDLSKKLLCSLLIENGTEVPVGMDSIFDYLADAMTFGTLKHCKTCKGQFVFDKFGYRCQGNVSEWLKCDKFEKEPERKKFRVPDDECFEFLKTKKFKVQIRAVRDMPDKFHVKKEEKQDTTDGPKVQRSLPALYDMTFVILGVPVRGKDVLKREITKLGGKVVTKISDTVMAVIASESEVKLMTARATQAKENNIQVVSEDFIDDAPNYVGKVPELVKSKSICDWGSDPKLRMPTAPSTSKSKSKSMYTRSVPKSMKVTLKGGTAVDPDSGLESRAHVYAENKEKYTVVLANTDIQSNKNSYYKLQLLQSDSGNSFWVFRAWGRTGTTIGSKKLEKFASLHEAKSNFMSMYKEKSGNDWENRHNFVKYPGCSYPVDIDYEEDDQKLDITGTSQESKLALPVQNLIRILFDVKAMKKLMLEFELDMEKMPLGKLSKKQISQATSVLSRLQTLIDNAGSDGQFIEASNQFYTFIPHSFGVQALPIIKTTEVVMQKLELLDNLREIEIAYSLMKSSGSDHSVDAYYTQLNTDVDVLARTSEEFNLIDEYVRNTHAATHSNYTLDIEDVFIVKRNGEDKRFKPFKKVPNHKLLWHGSRTTNFAGILAQGLRIAPPEAPVTGYMFGKGIYFADMVSKSANYCCTSQSDTTGILLLCDVALGSMYERNEAEYVEKLPRGKHSTKGMGKTYPDPSGSKQLNGVEVPCGKPVSDLELSSSLLYNEYIVYDVAQVNVRYLLKVKFNYNY